MRKLRSSSLWMSDDHDVEHHGAAILLLVRNGIAQNWEGLCRTLRFDRDRRAFHSGHFALKRTIGGLMDSGLLESENGYAGPYRVTDRALALIQALGVSLTQAANMPYHSGMAIRPTFGKPQRLEHEPHVFVIMPFRRELRQVYEGPVKSACRALRFSVERADDIFAATDLLSVIWQAIVGACIVVADCTDKNPNVFYELGISHTLGKPVVLLTQREEDVPVDVRHMRYIKYSPTPTGLRQLERDVRRALREVGESVWAAEQAAAGDGGRNSRARRPAPRTDRRR